MRRILIILLALLAISPARAADSTVSAMTAASAFGGTELLYIVQGAADRKGTPAQMATYVYGLASGDCTISGVGAVVCTKTNGVAFTALATTTPATGVATFLATPSSANLLAALTTKTGTGSAVFGTAPTMSSPTINTAATFGFITGSTQCLHVDTSGVLSGTGSDCGSSGGSGTVTSVGAGCGTSTGGSAITNSGNVLASSTLRINTTTSDPVVAGDCGNTVYENNASSIAVGIAQAGTTGFAAGTLFNVCNINAGTVTITPTTSTIGGAANKTILAGTATNPTCLAFQSDGTNYNIITLPAPAGLFSTTGALKGNGSGVVSQAACADLSNGTTLCSTSPGTGVATAAAANLSAAGGLTTTIASGTSALGTGAITSATCATVVTTAATNTATTDVVLAGFNGDPHAVTGYIPSTSGMLTIISYPTANNVNFLVCNNTSGSITPGAITLNWRVVR